MLTKKTHFRYQAYIFEYNSHKIKVLKIGIINFTMLKISVEGLGF